MIKDSGNRREFTTGAVRDLQEGKGRMDLLAWDAIIEISKHCEKCCSSPCKVSCGAYRRRSPSRGRVEFDVGGRNEMQTSGIGEYSVGGKEQ